MKKTPIFSEITDLILPNIRQDPDEFTTTSATTLLEFTTLLDNQVLVMAPRFYLTITAPNTYNSLGSIPGERYPIYNIDGRYYIRLLLTPSVGWGVNSCYKVDYRYWVPLAKGVNYTTTTKPTKGVLKSENWHVPSHNGYRSLNYKEYLSHDKARPLTNTLTIERTTTGDEPLSNYGVIEILHVLDSQGNEYDTSLVLDPLDTLASQASNTPVYSSMSLRFNGASPILGETFTITYVRPVPLKDVIFLDVPSKDNIYSNIYYPGIFNPL